MIITNNRAGTDSFGVFHNNRDRVGGGFYNSAGSTTLVDATIEFNETYSRGGAIFNNGGGTVTISSSDPAAFRSTISNNTVNTNSDQSNQQWRDYGSGGAIHQESAGSTLNLTGVDVNNNSAPDDAGAIFLESDGSFANLTDVILDGNTAGDEGGAMRVNASGITVTLNQVEITNNQAGFDDAAGSDHGGGIRNAGVITGTDVLIANNIAGEQDWQDGNTNNHNVGGGIYSSGSFSRVELQRVTIADNQSYGRGGGIYNSEGVIDLTDFAITGNATDQFTNEGQGRGGGIWNSGAGSVILNRGEVSENTSYGHGGGYNQQDNGSTLSATNVTFSGNLAGWDPNSNAFVDGRVGGAIWAISSGAVALDHVTITNNRTTRNGTDSGAGIRLDSGGNYATIKDSIISGNLRNIDAGGTAEDIDNNIGGRLTFTGNNIVGVNTTGTVPGASATMTRTDNPDLGALQDNGGYARSHAPNAANLAGAIDGAVSSTTGEDQRGLTRPVGAARDIGAIEDGAPPEVTAIELDPSPTDENTVVTLNGIGSSDGSAFDVEIDWGDGSPLQTITVAAGETTFSVTHTYADDDTAGTGQNDFTVEVNAVGQTTPDVTGTVTVDNVAPTVTATGDQTVDEGTLLNLTDIATFTDPGFSIPGGESETFTYSVDWGDGSAADTGTATIDANGSAGVNTTGSLDGSHVYADNGIYTVTVTVTDDDGGTSSDTFLVTVNNVAPTGPNISDRTEYEGATVTLPPFAFTDPGTLDTHPTVLIEWGDGSPIEIGTVVESPFGPPGSVDGADFSISLADNHVYTTEGIYTVKVTVVDDDGGRFDQEFTIYVVPPATDDPEAPATLTTPEDTPLNINPVTDLLANDLATDPSNIGDDNIALIGVTPPSNGVLSLVGGNLVYTPNHGFSGDDTFTYTIDNGEGSVAQTDDRVTLIMGGTPAADLSPGALEADDVVSIAVERQNVKLGADLAVDANSPGTFTAPGAGATINAGTIVNSHIVHFDGATPGNVVTGSITFDTAILGIIWNDAGLDGTDALLGNAATTYPPAMTAGRGLFDGNDSITISPDGKTLTFSLEDAGVLDQFRVLTAPDPNETATVTITVTDVPHDPKGGVSGMTDEDNSVTINVTDPNTWTQQGVLTPDHTITDINDQDRLGQSVAIDGDIAVIGGTQTGVLEDIFVYRYDGSVWNLEQRIINPDGVEASDDNFGISLAVDAQSGQIFVGTDRDDRGPGNNGGVVHIYNFDAGVGAWELNQTIGTNQSLVGLNGEDSFGSSIDVYNDGAGNRTLVVGARLEDTRPTGVTTGSNFGAAYVFTHDGTNWVFAQQLKASDSQSGDEFGESVAIHEDTIVVGAENEDTGGGNAGSAYVYKFQGGTWVETQVIRAQSPLSSRDDRFGISVDVSGDAIVIGARLADNPDHATWNQNDTGRNRGAAYIFREDGPDSGNFVLEHTEFGNSKDDQFGYSVAIEGDTVIAGGWLDGLGGEGDRGTVVVMTYDAGTTTWTAQPRVGPSDGGAVTPHDQQHFGRAVAITSDGAGGFRYLVGSEDIDVVLPDGNRAFEVGGAHVLEGDATGAISTQTRLTLPPEILTDLDADNEIGRNVSISADGNIAVVGAPLGSRPDDGANDDNRDGVVYVYQRNVGDPNDINDDTWVLTDTLRASNAGHDDRFGQDVSISHDGSTIVVGAYAEDTGGTSRGSAYVFEGTPGAFTQVAKLNHAPAANSDELGYNVAVNEDGSIIAVGARRDHNALNNDEGSVFVWTRDTTTGSWSGTNVMTKLEGDGQADAEFGRGLALSGNRLVVGAWLEETGNSNSGAAYVFEFDGFVWQRTQKLTIDNDTSDTSGNNDRFGLAVDIHGDVIVVGAYQRHNQTGNDDGAAYVFRHDGTSFVQEAELTASNFGADDEFGRSVAVYGDRIIVGAHQEDSSGTNAGAAYIFSFDGTTWTETEMLLNEDRAANSEGREFFNTSDNFGTSVDIGAMTALVGAPNWNLVDDNGTPDDTSDDIILRNYGAAVPFELAPFDADGSDTFTVSNIANITNASGGAGVGLVTTDGTSITFDPNMQFEYLLPGETEIVTFTYDLFDGSETSTVTGEIIVKGVNDAPVGETDTADCTTSGITEDSGARSINLNVLTNDTDPDDMTGTVVEQQNLGGVDSSNVQDGIVTVALGANPIGEVGSIASVTDQIQTVTYTGTFTNPVIIASVVTDNESDPVVVRISNIDTTAKTFDIQLAEPTLIDRTNDNVDNPTANDGVHAAETVTFIIMEAGTHVLQDGTRIEVGTVTTDNTTGNGGYVTQNFSTEFQGTPAVLTQVQTTNSLHTNTNNPTAGRVSEFLKTRQRNSTADSFQVSLENQENFNAHPTAETIGYIAIETGGGVWDSSTGFLFEAGRTAQNVAHNYVTRSFSTAFTGAPNLVTSDSTANGGDDGEVRQRNVTSTGFEAKLQEDTAANYEIGHAAEIVDYLAIQGSGFLYAIDPVGSTGNITFDPNGQFNYLAAGETAVETVTYVVRDAGGLESTSTVDIEICGVNDATTGLTATTAALSTNEGAVLNITDLVTFSDLDLSDFTTGPSETWSITIDWGDGTTSTLNGDGTVTNGTSNTGDTVSLTKDTNGATNLDVIDGMGNQTPSTANQFSVDASHTYRDDDADDMFTITITVNDGNSSVNVTKDVTVLNVDPTAVADTGATDEDTILVVNRANGVLLNDTDPANTGTEHPNDTETPLDFTEDHNDQLTVTGIQGTASLTARSDLGATVTMAADGSYTYDPTSAAALQALAEGQVVTDTFSYSIQDQDGGTSTATVSLTITGRGAIEIDMNHDFPPGPDIGYANPQYPGDDFTPGSGVTDPGDDAVDDTVNVAVNGAGDLVITVNGEVLQTVPAAAINNGQGVEDGTTTPNPGGNHDILFTGSGDGETLTVGSLGNNILNDLIVDPAGGADQVNFTGDSALTGEIDVMSEGIAINADLTTADGQNFDGPVTLGGAGPRTLTSTNSGAVTFTETVDGAKDLTVNTAGATTFEGPIGSITQLTSVTTDQPGTVAINGGSVTTTGDQAFNEIATLGMDTVLNSTGGGDITLGGADGAVNLDITTKGAVNLNGDVGGSTPLTSLDVQTGESLTVSNDISTTGDINLTTREDFTLTPGGSISSTGGTATINIDHRRPGVVDNDPSGASAVIRGDLDIPGGLTVNGGQQNDAFTVTPSPTTPITVNGNRPHNTTVGDTLAITNPNSKFNQTAPGDGYYETTGFENVSFTSIESDNQPPRLDDLNIDDIIDINRDPETTLTGTVVDAGVLTEHILTIDWGDGNIEVIDLGKPPPHFQFDPNTGEFSVTHTYAKDGIYDVTLSVVDDFGESSGPSRLEMTAYFDKPFFTFIGPNRLEGVYNLFHDLRQDSLFTGSMFEPGVSEFNPLATTMAPFFAGSTSPWGQVIGRLYNEFGQEIGVGNGVADGAGNWSMTIHTEEGMADGQNFTVEFEFRPATWKAIGGLRDGVNHMYYNGTYDLPSEKLIDGQVGGSLEQMLRGQALQEDGQPWPARTARQNPAESDSDDGDEGEGAQPPPPEPPAEQIPQPMPEPVKPKEDDKPVSPGMKDSTSGKVPAPKNGSSEDSNQ